MQTKMCSNQKCSHKEPQPLSSFHKNSCAKDGLRNQCKDCARAWAQSPAGRISKAKADKRYAATDKSKIVRRKARKRFKESEKGKRAAYKYRRGIAGRAASIRNNETHRERFPEHIKARVKVREAVRKGILPHISTQQCNECSNGAACYHHESYEVEHWLDVLPLCWPCHSKRDRWLLAAPAHGQIALDVLQ